jgi:presequence protease
MADGQPEILQKGEKYKNFLVTQTVAIPEIHCHLTELTHEDSGASIMHIAADDPENFFCLSFRTPPPSSNGLTHILEHTVLTGSKKYPVKDPFFSMNRRSLNTFMNALTGPDFTCYPASTQVEQDFYNLLSVYLDAVFHPLLKKLSFHQEGWRLEFTHPQDPTSPLEYKGIVYNEMKGALSHPASRLIEALNAALFPNSPYGFNSGGDPRVIPYLSHEELVNYHKKYYHPSKCLFFFYGNLPLKKHLDFLLENAFHGVKKEAPLHPIESQPRFPKGVRKELTYPQTEDEENEDKTLLGFGWLTTSPLDQLEVLALTILDICLMNTDASLLKIKLLQSGLCKQANSSLEIENRDVPYVITLKGCRSQDANQLEELIRSTLMQIAETGIPEKLVSSALHQLELDRSEIGEDDGPFGLSLYARAALLKQHGGNPEDGLRIHSLFQELQEAIRENPSFLRQLIVKYLLNNKHFVRITLNPSKELAEQELKEEKERLERIRKSLSEHQVKKIITLTEELRALQESESDNHVETLPKISLSDVPKKPRKYDLFKHSQGNVDIYFHNAFTNQIAYLDLVFPLPEVKEEELWLLRLFSFLLPQVGSGMRNYQENLEYIQENTGGLGAGIALNIQVTNFNTFTPTINIRSKALYRKSDKLFRLLFDTATSLNFTERSRLKELILKHYSSLQSSLNQNALRYAMNHSASHLSQANAITCAMYGLDYFHKIKHLATHFESEADTLIQQLEALKMRLLCTQGANLVVTCDETEFYKFLESGFEGLVDIPAQPFSPWKNNFSLPKVKPQARMISAPVAFMSKAFKCVPYVHPDAVGVSLAAQIFENVVLHKRIREQGGAYGGGASFNPTAGTFYFFSYRDPNIASTAVAFDEAIATVAKGGFKESDMEEAKLEILQGLDAPIPPGGRGAAAYASWKEGKTYEMRKAYRDNLMNATPSQVQRAVQDYIAAGSKEGVLVAFAGKELAERENIKLKELGLPTLHLEKI